MTSCDRFLAAAHGQREATLWGGLIQEKHPETPGRVVTWELVSTRSWPDGFAALQAYRTRWRVEADHFRELKEG